MDYSSLFKLKSADLSTEAEVETRLLPKLFTDLGYPDTAIIPKKLVPPLIANNGSKEFSVEVDFILKDSDGTARIVVEAKDPTFPIHKAWGQAASYALSWNREKLPSERIRWLLISNGHITSLYAHDSSVPIVTLQLQHFASGAPPYVALRSYIKYRATHDTPIAGLAFETISPEKLNALFQSCHDLVWKKEKLNPTDAFFEFCKFIFIKIREDKAREAGAETDPAKLPLTLAWLSSLERTSPHPVRDILFVQLRDELEAEIRANQKRRIFEPMEKLLLSASTCKELIKRFQTINLSSIDEDLNGRMFEVFLNAAVRGKALGQYFTPRSVVDFMARIALLNKDAANPPKVIDACSGTAGFLIEVMAYLLSQLRGDTRVNARQRAEIKTKICNELLYGIDGNERVSRIARINMYLHGDGGSHIFYSDGLDSFPEVSPDMSDERRREIQDHVKFVQSGTFDLALTNPPFSMVYDRRNDDESRIMGQRTLVNGKAKSKSNVLFLDRYEELLRPEGELLIVLDDTILNGKNFLDVREWIFQKFVLLGVHSLPFNAFFKAKANIKTSILHLRKKVEESESQGFVFMSISNNIGHDNGLRDTLDRNNLQDVLVHYLEWKRTGNFETVINVNQDPSETLECPEQIFLVAPDELTSERIDAFYYAPVLKQIQADLERYKADGKIDLHKGSAFKLLPKLRGDERDDLIERRESLRYVEISYVTEYGLILHYDTQTLDNLPTRGQYRVKAGDILLALNNSSRGTVVYVPPEFDGAICTSGFLVIRPRSDEEGSLLWYALRSDWCKEQVYYLAQTASQPELKLAAWKKHFLIPMPKGKFKKQALAEFEEFRAHLFALSEARFFRLKEATLGVMSVSSSTAL